MPTTNYTGMFWCAGTFFSFLQMQVATFFSFPQIQSSLVCTVVMVVDNIFPAFQKVLRCRDNTHPKIYIPVIDAVLLIVSGNHSIIFCVAPVFCMISWTYRMRIHQSLTWTPKDKSTKCWQAFSKQRRLRAEHTNKLDCVIHARCGCALSLCWFSGWAYKQKHSMDP